MDDLIAAPPEARSSYLFTLAREAGLPCDGTAGRRADRVGDAEIVSFQLAYYRWACRRDEVLRAYLAAHPVPFRAWLVEDVLWSLFPWPPKQLLQQTYWYLDEAIIADPIVKEAGNTYVYVHVGGLNPADDTEHLRGLKYWIANVLDTLVSYKKAIEDGRILLLLLTGGGGIWKSPSELDDVNKRTRGQAAPPPPRSDEVSKEIREQAGTLAKILPSLYLESSTGDGRPLPRTEAFAEPSRQAMMLKLLQETQTCRAVPLLGQGGMAQPGRGALIQASLRVTLPYIDGVPPEVLFELRERAPEAFTRFRQSLNEYVSLHSQAGDARFEDVVASAQDLVRTKLQPEAADLDREMRGVIRKAAYRGVAAGAVACTGLLTGVSAGVGLLAAGVLGLATATADFAQESRRLPRSAAYFLWQAEKRKPRRRR